jgi:hypothetical protein
MQRKPMHLAFQGQVLTSLNSIEQLTSQWQKPLVEQAPMDEPSIQWNKQSKRIDGNPTL